MMSNELTIQIVGWNSAACLRNAFKSLQQCPEDVVIRYIDNNSSDGSVGMVRNMLPRVQIIELGHNTGFAAANNIGFKECTTDFVLLHNPDLELQLNSLPVLIETFSDSKVAAVQGMILKSEGNDKNIIDSAGIEMTWALNGRDRGEGEVDRGQYNSVAEIAAVTGAGGCYRMKALQEVSDINGHVFDEDFFAYKEDVDLGWRLRRAGWVCRYVPVREGIHPRELGKNHKKGFRNRISFYWQKRSDVRTRYSWRNWLWMVLKNATIKDAIKHEIFVDLRVIAFMLLSITSWPLLKVWPETVKGIPKMMEKRRRPNKQRVN